MGLTGTHNYFEDFEVGERYAHTRGKTVTEADNVWVTNLVMNTAQGHYNRDRMADSEFGERIVFGGVTLSIVSGLASADISENAIEERGYETIRFHNPVFHGTTLYAESEVLAKDDDGAHDDRGTVTFRIRGFDEDDETVVTAEKTVVLKKRAFDAGGEDEG